MQIYLISLLLTLAPGSKPCQLEKGALLHVEVNLSGGRKLILNDGSTWEIDPLDFPISSLWLSPAPLEVAFSESDSYPYFLIDVRTQMKVKAKPLKS